MPPYIQNVCVCVCQRKDNCRILMNVFEKVVIFYPFSSSISLLCWGNYLPLVSASRGFYFVGYLLYLPAASWTKLHQDVLEIESRGFVIPNDRIVVLKAISDSQHRSLFAVLGCVQ